MGAKVKKKAAAPKQAPKPEVLSDKEIAAGCAMTRIERGHAFGSPKAFKEAVLAWGASKGDTDGLRPGQDLASYAMEHMG